jgi:hypothetical protein
VFLVLPFSLHDKPNLAIPTSPIDRILAAPPTSSASLSPYGDWLLEMERHTLYPIAELAEPEVAIAGFRINPTAQRGLTLKEVTHFRDNQWNCVMS